MIGKREGKAWGSLAWSTTPRLVGCIFLYDGSFGGYEWSSQQIVTSVSLALIHLKFYLSRWTKTKPRRLLLDSTEAVTMLY